MYVLKLTLLLWTIIPRMPLPSEHTVLLFQTQKECLNARALELDKLMDRVPAISKKLDVPVGGHVVGGCKAPTTLKTAAQPPESSGG